MEEEKKQLVNINNQQGIIKELISCGLIDEQGVRISGNGIIIKQLGDLKVLVDKTNLKIYGLGKDIEKGLAGVKSDMQDNLNKLIFEIQSLKKLIDEKIPKL